MNVLVTGAEGFVGSHVMGRLAERGWESGWEAVAVDLGRPFPDVDLPIDVVISLAATADPSEALRDPAAAYENGVRVMVETLEYARRVGARVLHVSTNEVYGSRVGPVYDPKGPYAGAKACQEIVCRTYRDVPVTVVVTQSLFGERQQPNKLIPTAVRAILAGEPVRLQHDGLRWAARPFLHAGDLADALLELAIRPAISGRVHAGADRTLSVRQVVDELADALVMTAIVEAVPVGDRAGHELDVEPIGHDIEGWSPRDALALLPKVATWYRDHAALGIAA